MLKLSHRLTETNVPGRKIMVIAANVFMAAESRLLAIAIIWEVRATSTFAKLSC